MNHEVDPTLTGRAQNSYAEGMAEGGETNQNSEADAEVKAAQEQAEREKTEPKSTAQAVSPDASYIADRIVDAMAKQSDAMAKQSQLGLENISRTLGSEVADSIGSALRQGRQPSLSEQAAQVTDQIQNPSLSPEHTRDAYLRARDLAQLIIKSGVEATPTIKTLAESPDDLPQSQMKMRTLDAVRGKEFINKLHETETFRLPGRALEADSDVEYLNLYYPPSLEDVGERAEQVVPPEYKSGGKYEIIHVREMMSDTGEKVMIKELRYENLLRWMRRQWLLWGHQFEPDNPRTDPWNTIQILSYSGGISLGQMVTNERYWQKKQYKFIKDKEGNELIKMKPKIDRRGQEVWEPDFEYVKDKGYNDLRNEMIMEFYMWGKAHAYDATARPLATADSELHKKVGELMRENSWLQDQDRLRLTWMIPATSGTKEEVARDFSWMGKEKGGPIEEGRLGKAHRLADVLYFRLGHIENMKDNENLFFERLGEEGKKEFFRSMVNRGLDDLYKEKASMVLGVAEKVDLAGVDLAEILFRDTPGLVKDLFTKNENEPKKEALVKYLEEQHLTLDEFIKKTLELREEVLQDLTGRVNFRDATKVRELFQDVLKEKDLHAMEELGLRFIDTKLSKPQGDEKWGDPEKARKAVRKELNLFNKVTKPKKFEKALRHAIQDAIGKVNHLDSEDAEYAENFAFAKVYWTFSAGFNDTTATGFNGGTKTMHMSGYRKNNFGGGKNYVGNIQNLYGVKRTVLPFWMAMYGYVEEPDGKKTKKSLLSVMENGFTRQTRPKNGNHVNTLKSIDFEKNIETTYAGNHLTKGWALYERHINGAIFELAKYVTVDNFGRVKTNPEAIKDILSKVNNEIRYTFNQMGFDFEDMIETIDVEWKRDPDGKMVAEPQYVRQKLKDFLFDKEIVNMGMYERRMFADRWVNSRVGMKDAQGEDMLIEYSRNILGWLLSKEILEHRLYNSSESSYNYDIWELDMIRAVEGLFGNIPMGEFDERSLGLFNKNKKLRKTESFFNRKEFKKIRLMGNAGYGKLWMEELRAQLAESAWKGSTGTTKKFFGYIFQDIWNFK